jgi:hypothetical protein
MPIIKCTPLTVKEKLRYLLCHRETLPLIGKRSRQFVLKHHSLESVGEVFNKVNTYIGLRPLGPPEMGGKK